MRVGAFDERGRAASESRGVRSRRAGVRERPTRLRWWPGAVGAGERACGRCTRWGGRPACWPRSARSPVTRRAPSSARARYAGRAARAAAARPARGTPCRCAAYTGGSRPQITRK